MTGPIAAAPPVERLDRAALEAALDDLARLLHACVEAGASLGFVAPFGLAQAREYWLRLRPALDAAELALLVVRDGAGRAVGTVQVVPAGKANGAHRAEIAKLLVQPRARRAGLGAQLMLAAEAVAAGQGRTLLVLDTATAEAERLYLRLGYLRAGIIPGYARAVHADVLDATTIMYKQLTPRTE